MPDRFRKPRALIVDDIKEIHSLVEGILDGLFECESVLTLAACLAICETQPPPDVVILDLTLHGEAMGFDSLRQFKARFPRIPVVIFTANNNKTDAIFAIRNGAQAYLVKDQNIDFEHFRDEVVRAIARSIPVQQLHDSQKVLEGKLAEAEARANQAAARVTALEAEVVELKAQVETLKKKPQFLDKKSKVAIATAGIIGVITTLLAVFGDGLKAFFKWMFTKQ